MRLENMAKTNAENLFENANAGFKVFEEQMLKKSGREIFDNAYEINAKNEIHSYLCDCSVDELGNDEIKVLVGLGDAVIDELYEYFMGVDNASIMFYSDITEWVEDYCRGGNKR